MRAHNEGGARHWHARVLRWTARLLVIGGSVMLAWCALLLADAFVSQRSARQSLETIARVTPPAPADPRMPATVQPASRVRRGAAIAALTIPRIALSAVVLHGSDDQTLRRGPGHLEGTAMPGEAGNAVVAGHRDSFFRPLQHVRIGDDVFIDAPHGRVQYRVTSLQVVEPRDLSALASTEEDVLTLITCYPFWLLGNAPDRFVVRATRVGGPMAMTTALVGTPPPFRPLADPFVPQSAKPAARELAVEKNRATPDDATLIRHAIERFRLTYNARLISRNDHRPGGLLEFHTCEVIVDGDQAVARCGPATGSDNDAELKVWTSTLQRVAGAWMIKQIAPPH